MDPQQQAIVSQWQQHLQQVGQQVTQLLQQAQAGCQALIAKSPEDPTALENALGAIGQQVDGIRSQMNDTFDSFVMGRLSHHDDAAWAEETATRARETMEAWMEESWEQFMAQKRWEVCLAMWPLAQAALQRPTPCQRCGGPLQRATPHAMETVHCQHCGAVNQAAPEAVVARYYGRAPEAYAHLQSLPAQFEVSRYRRQVEVGRREHNLRTGDWPDETIDSLTRWEQLERARWDAYVSAKAKLEPSDEASQRAFVGSRMKFFYDEMNRNDVWRAAHGMPPLHVEVAVDGPPEWGPLRPDQIEEYFYHDALVEDARPDPARLQQVLTRLGYRDPTHYARVKRTFLNHHEETCGQPWFQEMASRAVMRAQNDLMAQRVASSEHLFLPVEGVSFDEYAGLTAHQGRVTPEEFLRMLAQHSLDRAKFDRVSKAFMDRMSTDTTGAMATRFSKAWAAEGTGAYADAARAGVSAMGAGGLAMNAPSGAEPITFERYAEVSGAMAAWTKQGKDISAMLSQAFQMSAQDVAQVGMYWSARMTSDFSLMEKLSAYTGHFEAVYLGQKPKGSPLPTPGPDGKFLVNPQTREMNAEEQQAYQYLSARDYVTANNLLRGILSRDPTNPVALALRSYALGNQRSMLGPGAQLDALLREQSEHAPTVLATLERDRIDTRQPLGQIQLAALVEAHAIVARDKLWYARSENDISAAADVAEEGLEIHENHPELLKIRCLALFRMEDWDEAKEVLARVMAHAPDQGFMQQIAPYVARAPKDDDDDDDD